jgi:peptidoglycan/LPS O-acetylase OafA/YrhL
MNIYSYSSPIFRLGEFIIGITIYIVSKERNVTIFRNGWLALLLTIFLIIFLITPAIGKGLSFYSFASIPAFTWLVSFFGANKPVPILKNILFIWLGRISYSFYLVQFFTCYLVDKMEVSLMVKWGLAFIFTLGMAIIFYVIIEKPFRGYIKRITAT